METGKTGIGKLGSDGFMASSLHCDFTFVIVLVHGFIIYGFRGA